MKKWIWIASTLLLLLLTACSNEKSHETKHDNSAHEEGGDIREKTASIEVLPDFLNEKPEDMQKIYTIAAKNKELLEQIPCYCGCGESVGHKDNYDCFVHQNNGKAITWDDHGTKCGVCMEIAVEAVRAQKAGQSVKEIRKAIDEKYKEGYAEPTPTPAVS